MTDEIIVEAVPCGYANQVGMKDNAAMINSLRGAPPATKEALTTIFYGKG